jgi:outer membrane protein assembly factor BamD (BamD/ComL family)
MAGRCTTRAAAIGAGIPGRVIVTLGVLLALAALPLAQTPASNEEIARRQLESGRSFMRQGSHAEAIRDFRAVADRYGTTASADDALLELARYYLDQAGDTKEASAAVDVILAKYSTSNSAPDAYVLAGRLALGRSRRPEDLANALANFERVGRLFPSSDAVPQSLQLAGETLWYGGRLNEAMGYLGRVEVEYPSHPATAAAHLSASRVLVSLGDPIAAMEDLQQVRNRWPNTGEAAEALARLTLLHRLYVRAPNGAAFALSTETVGPAKVNNVVAMAAPRGRAIYYAADSGVGLVAPADAAPPPTVARPRGLAVDNLGRLVVLDGATLRTPTGDLGPLALPRPNGVPEPLAGIDSAVQFSTGDWLVIDPDKKGILWFNAAGGVVGLIGSTRVTKIALNATDEIAGLDRDQKAIALWDPAGKPAGRIPFRGAGYDLQNPEDLAFDAFGHLYVLDRTSIAVFGPHPVATGGAAPAAPADRGAAYRLLTIYTATERPVGGLRRATSFAIDQAGTVYVHDDRAQRILVFR